MTVVKIIPKGDVLRFEHDGSELGKEVADYVCGLVKDAKRLGPSRPAVVAKARLADAVLEARALQEEKAGLLIKQAGEWEERSRDVSLNWDIRQLNAERARSAREEARKLAQELGS